MTLALHETVGDLSRWQSACIGPLAAHHPHITQAGLLRMITLKEARREKTRNRAFSAVAPRLWNKSSSEIRLAPSLAIFKDTLKTLLFQQLFQHILPKATTVIVV